MREEKLTIELSFREAEDLLGIIRFFYKNRDSIKEEYWLELRAVGNLYLLESIEDIDYSFRRILDEYIYKTGTEQTYDDAHAGLRE